VAEIATTDLSAATLARFGSTSAAQAAINAVLAAARRYCRWYVSPVKTGDVVTLDGPVGCVLDLPTRKLSALTSVVEAGTTLDVTKLDWSADGPHGAPVRKQSGARWSSRYRSIVVTMTHGFTEAEAADWRKAIIDMVNTVSYSYVAASASDDALKRKRVDDVEYEWFDFASTAGQAVYTVSSVLDAYRIPEVLFV
jgi:hypothetical protein